MQAYEAFEHEFLPDGDIRKTGRMEVYQAETPRLACEHLLYTRCLSDSRWRMGSSGLAVLLGEVAWIIKLPLKFER